MSVPWGVWFEPTQPVRRLVELARLGESLGAEACFVADEGTERDVYVALTAIVEATGLKVAPAITKANEIDDRPVVLEFRSSAGENVFPMVPAGRSNSDIVVDPSQRSNSDIVVDPSQR